MSFAALHNNNNNNVFLNLAIIVEHLQSTAFDFALIN